MRYRAAQNTPTRASCTTRSRVAAVTHPQMFIWEDAHAEVETTSELTRGLVVADRGLSLTPAKRWNTSVAVDADVTAFTDLFLDRLLSLVREHGDSDIQPRTSGGTAQP